MMEMMKRQPSHCWWFDSHSSTKRSPWLQSTLSELEQKTQAMLKLIEEDADSFAKRAEMYYKKRPQLISMVEEFYRAHRSLAERYDQVKSHSSGRLLTTIGSPFSPTKRQSEKKFPTTLDQNRDTYSEIIDLEDHVESEVDETNEKEMNIEDYAESEVDNPEEEEDETNDKEMKTKEIPILADNNEMRKLKEEVERLKEENRIQKDELLQKDEEKREAIRQLSFTVDVLRNENVKLRKWFVARVESAKKWKSEINSLMKGSFLGKLFNVSPTVVAL